MSDWKQRKYPKGSKVEVIDTDDKFIGIGTLSFDYDLDSEDNEMPRIVMEDGKIIYGYDCWWIPVKETREIHTKQFNKLLEKYHKATGFLSNLNKAEEHETFAKLLEFCQGIGDKRIVPVIINHLEKSPDWLFGLLRKLLKESPEIPIESRGKLNEITAIWLNYLKERYDYSDTSSEIH